MSMETQKTAFEQTIGASGELSAVLIHKDGTRVELGILRPTFLQKVRLWTRPVWRYFVSRKLLLPLALLLTMLGGGVLAPSLFCIGIVTTAGVNYMATDFASGGVTPTISGFKFHDSGTGAVAAAVTDTALGAAAGPARVTGTPSNPAANQYRTVATIAYTATLAITEWGLFSASTAGTLWDRRVFAAINVVSGDSVQVTYTLTVNNGGT